MQEGWESLALCFKWSMTWTGQPKWKSASREAWLVYILAPSPQTRFLLLSVVPCFLSVDFTGFAGYHFGPSNNYLDFSRLAICMTSAAFWCHKENYIIWALAIINSAGIGWVASNRLGRLTSTLRHQFRCVCLDQNDTGLVAQWDLWRTVLGLSNSSSCDGHRRGVGGGGNLSVGYVQVIFIKACKRYWPSLDLPNKGSYGHAA